MSKFMRFLASRQQVNPQASPARQLLFSEALLHSRPTSSTTGSHPTTQPQTMTDPTQEATMERILQEITEVGRRLEGMGSAITSLTAETKSMRFDIAGFQSRVTGLEQRLTTMEDHINTAQDRDQELLYPPSKLIDLEDRSQQGQHLLFWIPGTHRRAHGPFRAEGYEIRITTDFSKETSDRCKAFLALRARLRQLEMKYGLFEPARMWVTNNGVSKDFYEPEDL
ncbi:hypothetical protein NDU88_002763 [Pleurodeles waltl]|uniref:Uncharacterized protein n=1 Tax=Pleurodeles waltl TaxID=8319 RepID=A0AAV7M2L6_PLEWA|nr:hypothetical protein NDU88_002763 [Pleurodeles waltl]